LIRIRIHSTNFLIESFNVQDCNFELEDVPCPICRSNDDSQLLVQLKGEAKVGLELAFCKKCEHRYHRRLPSASWILDYYADDWESVSGAGSVKDRAKHLIRPLARKVKIGLGIQDLGHGDLAFWPGTFGILKSPNSLRSTNKIFYPDPEVKKVFEFGCGRSHLASQIKELGYEYLGTEASRGRAEYSRKLGLNVVHLPAFDFGSLGAEGSFDLAFSTQVLEHIFEPDSVIKSVNSLLRDSGYLLIDVPNASAEYNLFHLAHQFVHCSGFSLGSLARLLNQNGFNILRSRLDFALVILAQKKGEQHNKFEALNVPSNTFNPEIYLEPFAISGMKAGERYHFTYGNPLYEIRHGKEKIFQRDFPLHFKGDQNKLCEIEFTLEEMDSCEFPVILEYESANPPVWLE
jgi:SAM-dependent methyltransferase